MKNLIIVILVIVLIGNLKTLNFEFVGTTINYLKKGERIIERLSETNRVKDGANNYIPPTNYTNDYYYKSFQFSKSFNGIKYNFSYNFKFKIEDYNFYHLQEKNNKLNYYSQEFNNHQYLNDVVNELEKDAKNLNLTEYELAELTAAFVQNCITYKISNSKFPIETLVEGNADCKGKSTLLAALLKKEGYDMKFLLFPGHMASGIKVSDNTEFEYFNFEGKKYTIIESTQPGWKIGEFPPNTNRVENVLDVL